MALEQDIVGILTRAKAEIQANMQAKRINASGRTSRGFAVETYEGGVRLVLRHDETAQVECKPNGMGSVQVGTAPLNTLEIGREGGRVPKGFYYMIKQWTRDKGLQFRSESERQSFSFFTARKIMRSGTGRHFNPVDVWSTPVEKAQEALKPVIVKSVEDMIKNSINSTQTNF